MTTPEPASISTEPRDGFVAVGRVLGAWGVQGALRLESLTDFPDRFATGGCLWVDGAQRQIEHCHWRRGTPIVKLSGIDSHDAAAAERNRLVEIPETDVHALAEDEYFQHDLIGLSVRTADGQAVGQVVRLLPTGANDVLVVDGPAGQYLLPLIEDVVKLVDIAAGTVVVELLGGLEPAAAASAKTRRRARRPAVARSTGE